MITDQNGNEQVYIYSVEELNDEDVRKVINALLTYLDLDLYGFEKKDGRRAQFVNFMVQPSEIP